LHFVQKVVPVGTELSQAVQLAHTIAEQAPLAVVATRQSVRLALEQGPMAARAEFDDIQKKLANSADAAEGVRSFSEKRAAQFKGC
jgi:enoyl-CoA hydratase/carnithine racemase